MSFEAVLVLALLPRCGKRLPPRFFNRLLPNLRKLGGNCVSLSDMNSFRRQTSLSPFPVHSNRRPEPLSEQRYQDLLKNASAFFASAVVATEDVRQVAIDEINESMSRHGLTVDDLK